MSYRKAPHMNASLIREVRMIAQQFFQTKRDETFWGSRSPAPKAAPALKCVVCLRESSVARNAVTICNGNAVCQQHL